MKKVKVGINGFGRIGRQVFRALHKSYSDRVEVVAINDLFDAETNFHLAEYDSVYGRAFLNAEVNGTEVSVGDWNIHCFAERDPKQLAWGAHDVDVVVETKRGHKLGRIIREGAAAPNSGVPGIIGGYGAERVLHAQAAGIFRNLHSIADFVEAGEAVAEIETPDGQRLPVVTQISGILRGLLRDGYPVTKGFKVADVDPRRAELENCFLISDKARCIAGSVLELIAENLWK